MPRAVRGVVFVLAAALVPSPAPAQTWSGNGGNGSWINTGNWVGGTSPASSATTAITFTGSSLQLASNQDNLSPPFLLNSLTFDATAAAYSIAGNELRFSGASPTLIQNSANPISITAPVSFDGTGTIGGTGAGLFTLGNLTVRQGTVTLNRKVTVGGLTLGFDGGTQAVLSTGSNVLTLAGNVTFVQLTDTPAGFADTPQGVINGTINLGGADRTFAGIYSNEFTPFIDLVINATITGTGGFVKGGSLDQPRSWMILNAQNTYTGRTVLDSGSERLYLGVANALPSGTALVVRDFTSLYLTNTNTDTGNVGFSQSVGSLSDGGTAGGIVRLGTLDSSPVLTVGSDNTSTIFAGSITGGGSLVKVGTGTLTLSGNGTTDHNPDANGNPVTVFSTYSGGTTINGGTLLVNGQTGTNSGTGTGTVTVNSGGTLGGNGRVGGPVTLNGRLQGGNGTTAAGNPTLTTGAVTFATGSQLRAAVGGATPAAAVNSKVATAAAFNAATPASSVLEIHLFNDGTLDLTGSATYSVTLANFGSTNTTSANYSVVADNFAFSGTPGVTVTGTSLSLTFTPVPEPVAVLGVAALGAISSRIRRVVVRI
jgi:fibronectin-binding autotransporter adhesin